MPLLQKLLQRLRCSDQEGAGVPPLFPPDVVPAAELVRMAEDTDLSPKPGRQGLVPS